jgi:signal transduction histidine kinase
MEREESLQGFLIQKFIWILVLVGIAEVVITSVINRVVLPVVRLHFFPELSGQISLGVSDMILIVLGVLLLLVVSGLQALLPNMVREILQWIIERLRGGLFGLLPESQRSDAFLQMSKTDEVLLFLILLFLACFVVLPYILAAFSFARITMREFRQIQKEREAAQKEFECKRNLMLSDIAHDLRTPMTTVSGYAKALSDGMITDHAQQQDYLAAIQNKSARMNELLNLLFEYVKLDSEGFALDRVSLDLCELLRENAALIYTDVESAGMELEVEIPDTSITVSADRIQLSRVVTNLLVNAVRHNGRGTRIGLFLVQEIGTLYVMVADSGALIPEEQVEHLFDPFSRGDASRKSGGGSGLGLSIAQKVVQMHGWDLQLVQQPRIQHYSGIERYAKAFVIKIKNTL